VSIRYRQAQTNSGNVENIQFSFGSPPRDPLLDPSLGRDPCFGNHWSIVFIILLIALNPRSQSALLGDRVSTVNCHKQFVEFIRNGFSNTCLVFNETKMDFLVTDMKALT